MKIAILVPYYNEEQNLKFFIKEWENFLSKKREISKNLLFIFIDDGSTDKSSKIIKNKSKKLKYVIVKKKNSGHGDSCKFGYKLILKKYKNYDYIFQIDSDNQCDPKYFTKIYDLIKSNKYNFIFGYRKTREDGYLRFIISRIMSVTFFLKKFIYIKDLNTPYRMMKVFALKKVLYILNKNKEYKKISLFNCVVSFGIKKYSDLKWVNINFRKRRYGNSKYNFLKMLNLYLNFIYRIWQKKNRIVVTGGLGFIGRNFVKKLDSDLIDHEIIIYDKSKVHLKKLNLKSKRNKLTFILGNTMDIKKKLLKFNNIKVLFHFGEFSRIVQSFSYTDECFTSNTLGTYKVIKFCEERNIKIIYSASSSKFGNRGTDEHLSPYSWTKSKNIELIKNFKKWYGLKYEIVYFFNVYGGDHLRSGKMAAVIGIFEGQYLKNQSLTVVLPGSQLRDFTHIDDIVDGTFRAYKKNFNKEYLLGTGKLYSILKIAKLFKHKIKFVSERTGERKTSIAIDKNNDAFRYLNYKPTIRISDYINEFVKKNKK